MATPDIIKIQKMLKQSAVKIPETDDLNVIDFILGSIFSNYIPGKVELFKDKREVYATFNYRDLKWTIFYSHQENHFPIARVCVNTYSYRYGKYGTKNKARHHEERILKNGEIDLVSFKNGVEKVTGVRKKEKEDEKEYHRIEKLRDRLMLDAEKMFGKLNGSDCVDANIEHEDVKRGDCLIDLEISLKKMPQKQIAELAKAIKRIRNMK